MLNSFLMIALPVLLRQTLRDMRAQSSTAEKTYHSWRLTPPARVPGNGATRQAELLEVATQQATVPVDRDLQLEPLVARPQAAKPCDHCSLNACQPHWEAQNLSL